MTTVMIGGDSVVRMTKTSTVLSEHSSKIRVVPPE